MTQFTVEMKADALRAFGQLDDIENRTVRAVRQGWFTVGGILRNTARAQILEKPKSGRVYRIRRGSRIVRHRASAGAPAGPFNLGETPANRTGAYRRSIGYQVHGWEEMEFGSLEGRGADEYADFLENGTSNMLARPGIRNAYLTNQGNIVSTFENRIKEVFRS